MIWIWIIAAIVVSLFFIQDRINWYHYIWILLPIEMYGIKLLGAVIKPYMLFGLVIVAYVLLRDNNLYRLPKSIIVIFMLILSSDVINGLIKESIMQHIMFAIVVVIAISYVKIQENGIEIEQIEKIVIATTIGYGLIFSMAFAAHLNGINIEGIASLERMSPGIVMNFISTGGVNTFRLRGFCIDPNAVVTTLIPGATCALANLMYVKHKQVRSILAVGLFVNVVVCSGSRMGVICTIAMVIGAIYIGYKRTENTKSWIMTSTLILSIIILLMIFESDVIICNIEKWINDFVNSRASIASEDGRLTIWKTNMLYLIDNCKIFTGVGQNQIYLLSPIGLACHNTWLEWICGTGVIIGNIINMWILFAPISFYKRIKKLRKDTGDRLVSFIIAYIITLLCITTIDNITNSIVIFLLIIFRYGKVTDADSLKGNI